MWNFIVNTWNTFIFEPIFNLITIFIAIIPGHSFGIALIIFTLIIRFVLYPLTKKQALQIKKQKQLQPEIDKIKAKNKGNRQLIALETMALYKEHNFNPFAILGSLLLQIPIFIALFQTVRRISEDTAHLIEYSYGFVKDINWMQDLASNFELFDPSFGFGLVDLTQSAFGDDSFYLPAFIIVALASLTQYFVAKQTSLTSSLSNQQTLKQIMARQRGGEDVPQEEVKAATQRFTQKMLVYFIPGIIFIISLGWYAALPFYFLLNNLVQYLQQQHINKQADPIAVSANADSQQLEATIDRPLNAKQKKEQRRRQQTTANRKRVQATSKTVSKKKNQGGSKRG